MKLVKKMMSPYFPEDLAVCDDGPAIKNCGLCAREIAMLTI